jgi:hypothetical protein
MNPCALRAQKLFEGCVDFVLVSGIQRDGFEPQLLCSSFCIRLFIFDVGVRGIHEQCNSRNIWSNLSEQLNSLCAKYVLIEKDACDVPAGAVETFDQSKPNRVAANGEDDGHGAARLLGRPGRCNVAGRGNRRDAHGYKLGRKRRQPLIVGAGPAFLDADVAPFDEPRLRQSLPKRIGIEAVGIRRGAVQETYQRHLLLRRCRER